MIQKGVEFVLDTPEAVPVGYRDCCLNGWCFPLNPKDELQLYVVVDGTPTPAFIGLPRPDVAAHFNNPSLSQCGFIARFRYPRKGQLVSLLGRLNGHEFTIKGNILFPTFPASLIGRDSKVSSYKDWLRVREPELFWREDEIESRISMLPYRPLISIILRKYNAPVYFLKRCIESVTEQHYVNWQLCITDDQSADGQGGISAASNSALNDAKGDFVVLLDDDDELHPYALLELARSANEFDRAQVFYSDEDKIDQYGVRSQLAFKPDFDANILLSFNYLGRMIALRRSLVTELGGFRPSCDGVQDWDLLIRASELVSAQAIKHIRKPLYHWRVPDHSAPIKIDGAKAMSVLEDHVRRTAKRVTVTEGLFYGSMRMKQSAPKQIEVAVFVRPEDGAFQASVMKVNAGKRVLHFYQLIDCAVFEMAADTAGHPGSLCSLTELKGDLFVFINGPLESLSHLFFEELVGQAMRDDCALVTGISLNCDDRVLATGFVLTDKSRFLDPYVGAQFPRNEYMGLMNVVRSIDACPDTFFAVRREFLAQAGGLGGASSSRMQLLAWDLSVKARERGLAIISTPYAVATFSEIREIPETPEIVREQPPELTRLMNQG